LFVAEATAMTVFLGAVRAQKNDDSASAEAAHRATSIGLLGERAMRAGRPIGFDPTTERISGEEC
jgi:hypothetical protein